MTHWFSKLMKAIPTRKTTARTVATTTLKQWVSSFGIPSKVLTDNRQELTYECFAAMSTQCGVKAITATEYHSQSNRQVGRFIRTIFFRLRHNVAEHRKEWDALVLLLRYVYIAQVHSATKLR